MKINWERVFRYVCPTFNATQMKWFLCFGSLLTVIRDKQKFGNDDLDIGVFYDEFEPVHIKNFCAGCGWKVEKTILHDVDKKPLFMSLVPTKDVETITGPIHIDVFAWYLHKGVYYHTYDVKMENQKVPSKYIFKGVEKDTLDHLISIDNVANSMMYAKIPLMYGTLLDTWYTDYEKGYHWLEPRKCVSDTQWKLEMKSCSGFKSGKYEKVKWPK